MTIHRLLYRSDMDLVGTAASIEQQLIEIIRLSEARNAVNDLTGALLHTRGVFIQALEGPLPAIEATFERICCDLRHRRVELLELVHAEERVFAEWSMARITADHAFEKLFPCLENIEEQHLESASAQATIQLMRSLLIAGADRFPSLGRRRAPIPRSLELGV
ncbi:BLUF domain-containing protein [Methylobacterium planeticum]|uniref:BLUF domain-containing protein n=1 Tax=Methylobacterium planeticum TaxID=2615211 RepID=A0A6N6MUN3_9HYPH|nr:BLUF domain-containing protein [Methylobacterium planeticum]KAB1073441.1 BLUF domain-containing protein [Methylobacterium planeticum]